MSLCVSYAVFDTLHCHVYWVIFRADDTSYKDLPAPLCGTRGVGLIRIGGSGCGLACCRC
jgi:hypothetical protein